jgi:hypothetical protein
VTIAAATAILLVALAGCGSTPVGTSASPATAVPASAPLYIDAVVQPGGALKTDATSVARKLTGRSQPFTGLLKLLAGPTGKAPNYATEVKPWLGRHAGVFLSSLDASGAQSLIQEALTKILAEGFAGAEAALLSSGGLTSLLSSSSAQGALVLDTTDVAKARSFLEAQAHGAGARGASYHGISYRVAPDGIAEGIVHRFAVIGSEAGLQSVIATVTGGTSLAHSSAYSKLASTAEAGALGDAYISPAALTHSVKASTSDGSVLSLLESLLGQPSQVYLSLIPSAHSMAVDIDTLPSSAAGASGGSGSSTTGAQVLRRLPGTSWLALGIGDLGKTLGASPQGLHAIASLVSGISVGSFSIAKAFAPLSSPSINVSHDLLSWMGATGVFVSGSSLLNLEAALVVDSKNPALSRAAVPKLAQAYREAGGETSPTSIPGTETAMTVKLPDFPIALTMAYGQGKFVMGIGSSSVEEALSPQSTLASSSAYSTAASALGQGIQPSVAIEFATLKGLIESLGLNSAPGFSGIASTLGPLADLAIGGGESLADGVKRSRVVLGVQSSG